MHHQNNPYSFLHLLNLDAVGGVEELFTSFLECSKKAYPHKQHILVTGKTPHRFFEERLTTYSDSLTQEKYFCRMKIPSFLRYQRRKQAVKASKPQSIILWNRLESPSLLKALAPASQIIYYEHGASWIEPHHSPCKDYLKKADKIIACSHAAKRLLQLKWDVKLPIDVVENPLKSNLQTAKEPKKAPKQGFHIGYIGRLIPLKGIPLLLHAVKILKERSLRITLSIAGDGEEKARLQQEAKKLHIDSQVHFIGPIQNVHHFYSQIDVLVVPSIREPLGLVAQEAALSGCPVIATAVDGLPEVVLNGKTGYALYPTIDIEEYCRFGGNSSKLPDSVYDPVHDILTKPLLLDPLAIADCIERLIDSSILYESLSEQALEFAKKRPTIDQYTENLFNSI